MSAHDHDHGKSEMENATHAPIDPRPGTGGRWRRHVATALCGLAAATAVSAAGAKADAATPPRPVNPPTITATDVPRYTVALTAGPEGGLWTVERLSDWREGFRAVRHDAVGPSRAVALSPSGGPAMNGLRSGFFPLADGGVGVVVAHARSSGVGEHVYDVALARIAPGADRAAFRRLPQPARRATGFAVAGDGTVWFGRACDDAIYRAGPGRQVRRFALRRLGCGDYPADSAMTLGPDGSAWLVNLSQQRVARVDLRGRVREWRTDAARGWYGTPVLAADPRGGGIAFADLTGESGVAGRITPSGQLVSLSEPPRGEYAATVAYGDDATLWRTVAGGLERIDARGRATRIPVAGAPDVADLAIARDGAPWFTGGTFHWEAGSGGSGGWYDEPLVGLAGRAEVRGTWRPAPPGEPSGLLALRGRDTWENAELALGADGALWGTVMDFGRRSLQLVRVLPSERPRTRPAKTVVRRTLARSGRGVWLQLACRADRGRFCRGTVRLRGAAPTARFAIEGRSRAAVRVQLTRRAARKLRRARRLRTTIVVRSAGAGIARRQLTLRRGR